MTRLPTWFEALAIVLAVLTLFCDVWVCVHSRCISMCVPCKKADSDASELERRVITWATVISFWLIKSKKRNHLQVYSLNSY